MKNQKKSLSAEQKQLQVNKNQIQNQKINLFQDFSVCMHLISVYNVRSETIYIKSGILC